MSTGKYFTERRVTNKLSDYWNTIRGVRHHPTVEEIDSDSILDIWPYCFIVEIKVINGLPEYQFKYLGESIKTAYRKDLNAEFAVPIVSPNVQTIKEYLDEVFESLEPVTEESEIVIATHEILKVRQCFLPLGPQEEEINAVLGAMNYKVSSGN